MPALTKEYLKNLAAEIVDAQMQVARDMVAVQAAESAALRESFGGLVTEMRRLQAQQKQLHARQGSVEMQLRNTLDSQVQHDHEVTAERVREFTKMRREIDQANQRAQHNKAMLARVLEQYAALERKHGRAFYQTVFTVYPKINGRS